MIVLLASACDHDKELATSGSKTVSDHFDLRVGEKVVHAQIAVSMVEMQRGLMGRADLGPDEGMIFVYQHPEQMSFWMHDTPTPLDIGFFNPSGVLEEIYPLHPFDETSVKSRSVSLQFALEMRQGWFHDNVIRPGAQLDLKALGQALKARGYEPERYGLNLQ